jgi:hypothetical protein
VGTTRRFQSRPIAIQFKPCHTLATSESYSKFQISGEILESIFLWYGSKGATRGFLSRGV